ncbi:MAG: hypothetical protein ABI759_03480 [Candidatus Solibacter sp.]
MLSKREFGRWLALLVQISVLIAIWAGWGLPSAKFLGLALVYVLVVWTVAEGIMLFGYAAFSLAPFSDLLVDSLRASAVAMWFVPGLLLLGSGSRLAMFAGVAAVFTSARLLASSRAPKWEMIPVKQPPQQSHGMLFGYPEKQSGFFSRRTVPTICAALALQAGVYSLSGDSPVLTVALFATAACIWGAMSVALGAVEPRTGASRNSLGPGVLLTLLLTVALSAVLIPSAVKPELPVNDSVMGEVLPSPGVTRQLFERLAHMPPQLTGPAKGETAGKAVVTQMAGRAPAAVIAGTLKDGVPGVVLRPGRPRSQRLALSAPGVHLRFSGEGSLSIPFTGEYQLFRQSSGGLPAGAAVEPGTPLEVIYGTTNGGSMETVAVQRFDPPLDLTHCGRVLVVVNCGEAAPMLASIQFAARGRVEDGSVEVVGMRPTPETLEFQVPVTAKPLLVNEIRLSFSRPGRGGDRNARIAVERFTLVPRGRW